MSDKEPKKSTNLIDPRKKIIRNFLKKYLSKVEIINEIKIEDSLGSVDSIDIKITAENKEDAKKIKKLLEKLQDKFWEDGSDPTWYTITNANTANVNGIDEKKLVTAIRRRGMIESFKTILPKNLDKIQIFDEENQEDKVKINITPKNRRDIKKVEELFKELKYAGNGFDQIKIKSDHKTKTITITGIEDKKLENAITGYKSVLEFRKQTKTWFGKRPKYLTAIDNELFKYYSISEDKPMLRYNAALKIDKAIKEALKKANPKDLKKIALMQVEIGASISKYGKKLEDSGTKIKWTKGKRQQIAPPIPSTKKRPLIKA